MADAVEIQLFEQRAAVADEACGGVLDGEAQHHAHVCGAEIGHQNP